MLGAETTRPRAATALAVTRHLGPLAELEAPWRALVDESHPGCAFRSYPWIASWWDAFGGGLEPLVLVARVRDRIIGILPLYLDPLPLGGKQVRLMADRHVGSDYLGIVGRAGDAPGLASSFARHLLDLAPAEIALAEIVDDDPLLAALPAVGFATDVAFRYPCPAVRIAGAFPDYLASLPDGTGKQWHRRRRWLERQPGYRFDILREPADIEHGMEILFDLHRRRWALEGGSDGITTPEVEAFHRVAARGLAREGKAVIFALHVDGAPRAALYGFRAGDRFSFYQAGHDPAWRQRSVGTVVLGLAIEHSFAESLAEFDFLHGNEDYKLAWANSSRRTVTVSASSPGLRPWLRKTARSLDVAARGLAKKVLPAELVDWIRRQRKLM